MIALNYSTIIQIILFLIFWFLMGKILFKPFVRLLEDRERRTEGVKTEAVSLEAEARRLRAEYESAITKANDDGIAVKESILHEARQARERLLAEARAQAAGRLAAVREEVQREMRKGRELAVQEAAGIARQMAEKILGRKVG